jgi:glutathione S-transferase
MAPELTLYTMPISHYCIAAERMLALKGLPYRSVRVPYHDKRALLAATQQDYVPALVADGRVVPWQEIPGFLERIAPTPRLFPPGSEGIARVLQSWAHQVLEERIWRAVVTRIPAVLADEHERWVFEEMQTRARGPWHVLEARRSEFEAEMHDYFALVNALVDDRDWVLGPPSLADCSLYGGLSPLLVAGGSVPNDLAPLARWVGRVQNLGATVEPPASPAVAP